MWRLLPDKITPEAFKTFAPSKKAVLILSLSLVLLVDALDFFTRSPIHLSALMLAPISFVVWYVGFWPGIGFAVLGSSYVAVNYFVTQQYYPNLSIPLWNGGMLFLFFFAFSWVLNLLKRQLDKATELALTDHLSGLLNARSFSEALEKERTRSQRHGHFFSLCFLDLDNFKKVNDTNGHLKGDELLKKMAPALKKALRESDVVARLGGDEFAILLPETGRETADALADKLRKVVAEETDGDTPGVTPSIGVVTFYKVPEKVEDIIHSADQMMYEVKKAGKNRVESRVIGRREGDPKTLKIA